MISECRDCRGFDVEAGAAVVEASGDYCGGYFGSVYDGGRHCSGSGSGSEFGCGYGCSRWSGEVAGAPTPELRHNRQGQHCRMWCVWWVSMALQPFVMTVSMSLRSSRMAERTEP
jgi:hypothetical protein